MFQVQNLETRSLIRVIHSNVSKKASTVQQENPLKFFSRKIWWNETKGFIFAPRNLRETAGRKKEKMLEWRESIINSSIGERAIFVRFTCIQDVVQKK